jgi:hypothetical protein
MAAGNYLQFYHYIEGVNVADLKFGSATAKTVTVQFGVRAPAGTYSIVLVNGAGNRSYVAEYVIAAGEANTDVVKSVTIPGDVAGTWATDNTMGLSVHFGLAAGSTLQQAAGSWGTGNVVGSPNQFNFMGTVGNVFELFDVGLYQGNVAPAFEVPDYAATLRACKRYFQFVQGQQVVPICLATTSFALSGSYEVEMRAAPAQTLLKTTWVAANFDLLVSNAWVSATGTTMTPGGTTKGYRSTINGFTGLVVNPGTVFINFTTNLIASSARM